MDLQFDTLIKLSYTKKKKIAISSDTSEQLGDFFSTKKKGINTKISI